MDNKIPSAADSIKTDEPRPCDNCNKYWGCHGQEELDDEKVLRWKQAKACWVFEHWCETGRALSDVIERVPTEEIYKRLYPHG